MRKANMMIFLLCVILLLTSCQKESVQEDREFMRSRYCVVISNKTDYEFQNVTARINDVIASETYTIKPNKHRKIVLSTTDVEEFSNNVFFNFILPDGTSEEKSAGYFEKGYGGFAMLEISGFDEEKKPIINLLPTNHAEYEKAYRRNSQNPDEVEW